MVYEHLQTTEKSPQKEMSSNIRIEKICEWCGKQFTAQTTVTRFCSKRCSEHAYKERLRQQKIQLAKAVPSPKNSELKEKDYLTVAEAGQILGMTRQGVYKLIHRGSLTASKLSSRLTLIKRTSIEAMLDDSPYTKRQPKEQTVITELYTRADIREKYGVKDSWIYKVVAENNVPKTIIREYLFPYGKVTEYLRDFMNNFAKVNFFVNFDKVIFNQGNE